MNKLSLLLAVLLLAGCTPGGAAPSTTPASSASASSAPPSQPSASVVASAAVTITQADDGNSFQLLLGQVADVVLKAEQGMQDWQIDQPDPNVLAPSVNTAATTAQGVTLRSFKAVGPGTATISATDRAACPPGQACPHFVRAFRATVLVADANGNFPSPSVPVPSSPEVGSPVPISQPASPQPAPAAPTVATAPVPVAPKPVSPASHLAVAPTTITITNADDGKTLSVAVGSTVDLVLTSDSGMQPWMVQAPDPAVLAPAASPPAPAGAVARGYRAIAAGTTTVSATDRPACSPGQVCPHFIRAFRATVAVR